MFGFYWLLSEVTPPTLLYFSIKYIQNAHIVKMPLIPKEQLSIANIKSSTAWRQLQSSSFHIEHVKMAVHTRQKRQTQLQIVD